MEEGARRYAAFLSYSHKDAAAARRLHRRLESYRLPRRLVGTRGERGPVPARLTPVFRDREELPAAGDLSATVRTALAVSDVLVILCSPAAAASPWVTKEIDTFRALHPDRPIIAAILDGEPDEAFPPPLTAAAAEPLAADLRPGRDGRRLGFLKLVAGLSGVGLDALVQRDAQRRLRRVTAVTGVALAAVVAMAVLTAVALQARAEAQRQRAEAEGLVEFMLTDLRDRLKGVGRLQVLQAVNARALEYYGERADLSQLPTTSALRRARILQAIGDDSILAGRLDVAKTAFLEAAKASAEQVARAPLDPWAKLQLARSEYGLGRIHEVRQEWDAAEQRYQRFAGLVRPLARSGGSNSAFIREAAWSSVDLGNVQLNGKRDAAAAQHSYEQALGWFEQLGRLSPGDRDLQRDLANTYGWLADSYYARSDWQNSLRWRQQQLAIIYDLWRTAPDNVEDTYRYALAERGVAGSYRKLLRLKEASALTADARRLAIGLTDHDPDNSEWLLFRGFVTCDLLFGKLKLPARVSAAELRSEVRTIAAAMKKQHNPRVADLSRCAAAAGAQKERYDE